MNNEIYIAKGKLTELQDTLNNIEIRADSLLIQIRELLNPANDFFEFDTDLILELVKLFRELQLQAREIQEKIRKIKLSYNL
jgi:hypothetical protein